MVSGFEKHVIADLVIFWCSLSYPQVFAVHVLLDAVPLSGSAVRTVASGTSINWSAGFDDSTTTHEVTLGTTGRKLGAMKKTKGGLSPKTTSRLCSLALGNRMRTLLANIESKIGKRSINDGGSWGPRELKQKWGLKYQQQFSLLKKAPSPFEMWILKR